jgi:hypothetical protein
MLHKSKGIFVDMTRFKITVKRRHMRNSNRDYGDRKMRFAIMTLTIMLMVSLLILAQNHAMAQTMTTVQPEKQIGLAASTTRIAFFNNITSNSFNQTSLPPLTISPQNVSLYRDSIGTTHIIGVLTNPFTYPIKSVQITASAHNANHQLISTGSTYADQPDQLRPGEKSGFDISVTSVAQNAFNYELSVSYERAGTLKPAALYLYIGQSSIDSIGTYHLLGEVTNLGNTPTSFVDVT